MFLRININTYIHIYIYVRWSLLLYLLIYIYTYIYYIFVIRLIIDYRYDVYYDRFFDWLSLSFGLEVSYIYIYRENECIVLPCDHIFFLFFFIVFFFFGFFFFFFFYLFCSILSIQWYVLIHYTPRLIMIHTDIHTNGTHGIFGNLLDIFLWKKTMPIKSFLTQRGCIVIDWFIIFFFWFIFLWFLSFRSFIVLCFLSLSLCLFSFFLFFFRDRSFLRNRCCCTMA